MSMKEREPKKAERGELKNAENSSAQTTKELKDIARQAKTETDTKTNSAASSESLQEARQTLAEKASHQVDKAPDALVETSTETKTERSVEKSSAEKSESDKPEKTDEAPEQAAERSQEKTAAQTSNKRERRQAYDKTMKDVQRHLTPAQRSFSKFAHSGPVEFASEVLEETILRTSFIWGGVIGGLLLGGGVYLVARINGFELSGSEFSLGLLAGGLIGFFVERVVGLFHKKRS